MYERNKDSGSHKQKINMENLIQTSLVLIILAASVSANATVAEVPNLDTNEQDLSVCPNASAALRLRGGTQGPPFNCLGRCGNVGLDSNAMCSCDVRCHLAKTCCQGFSQACPRVSAESKAFAARMIASMGNASQELFDTSRRFMLVRRCPANWTDSNISTLCESHTNSAGNIETTIPVFGYEKKLHYYNQYCALCHSESAWQPWRSTIFCKGTIPNVTTDIQRLFAQLNALGCKVQIEHHVQESGLFNAANLPELVPEEKYRSKCSEHCAGSKLSALCDASLFPVRCYAEKEQKFVSYRNRFCVTCTGDNIVVESCSKLLELPVFQGRTISLVFFFSLRSDNTDVLVVFEPSKEDCTSPQQPCPTETRPDELPSQLRHTTHLPSLFSESDNKVLQVKMRLKHPLPVGQMEDLMQNVTNSLVYVELFDTTNNSSWFVSPDDIFEKAVTCFRNITDTTTWAPNNHPSYVYLVSPDLPDISPSWGLQSRDLQELQSEVNQILAIDFEVLAVRFENNFRSNISSCLFSAGISDFKGDAKSTLSKPEFAMWLITVIILVLSILCLVGRIILQIVPTKALNMGDQLQIVLVILLLIFYVSFLIAALIYSLLDDEYVIVRVSSVIALWALLSYFASTNALAVHLFKVICLPLETRRSSAKRHWKDFLIHSLLPGTVITLIATIMEFAGVPDEWIPRFGACGPSMCRNRPKILFLLVPFGLIMLVNLILLALIVKRLRKPANGLERPKDECHGEHYSRSLYAITFRLFTTMGLAWIVAFVNVFVPNYNVILDTITTLILGSMGIILLVTFICRSSTLKCIRKKQSKPEGSDMRSFGRTLSNQTCASTVSSVYSHHGRERRET